MNLQIITTRDEFQQVVDSAVRSAIGNYSHGADNMYISEKLTTQFRGKLTT